jgi:hypothetical protein
MSYLTRHKGRTAQSGDSKENDSHWIDPSQAPWTTHGRAGSLPIVISTTSDDSPAAISKLDFRPLGTSWLEGSGNDSESHPELSTQSIATALRGTAQKIESGTGLSSSCRTGA